MASLLGSNIREYQVVDLVGQGGMGEVYRAVHTKIGRVVAIKVLKNKDPRFLQRFFNEARIQAGLHHKNIAALYDYLEVNGRPCIIMEYVDGQTVQECVQARGRLSLQEAISIFQRIVEAIAYLHQNGIVHRDIKPNNIKINGTGEVKLLDFGIAKDTASPSLTTYGSLVGTLGYLSPEQIKGKAADTRSDVWSLGILFYEMITGESPFKAESPTDLFNKICKATYISPCTLNFSIPAEVDAIIAKCLNKNPAYRYASAKELLQDVQHLSIINPVPYPISPPAPFLKQYWPALLASVGAIFAVFVILSLLNKPLSPVPPVPTPPVNFQTKVTVTVDVIGSAADVYISGEWVGKTPHIYKGMPGERFRLQLKRKGFQGKEEIHEEYVSVPEIDRTYTFTLD